MPKPLYEDDVSAPTLSETLAQGDRRYSPILSTGEKLRRNAEKSRRNVWGRPYMKAVRPWQPSTAYRRYDVVANGGNLYVCVTTGTSAASGGPTITTGNSQSDNTAAWTYYGSNVVTQDPATTQTAWAVTTAYTAGQQVIAGNRVYACVAAGTSGASAPTGTTNSVTDGTVTWTYLGPTFTNPYVAEFPTFAYSTTAPSGLTNIFGAQASVGMSSMALRGCYNGGNFASQYVQGYTFTPTQGATPTGQHSAHEFWTDAPRLYFRQPNGAAGISVSVDWGEGFVRYSLSALDYPANANNYYTFDFSATSGRKPRLWRIEGSGLLYVSQIAVDSNSQVWAPSDNDKVTAACISDSIWAGSNYGPFIAGASVSQRLGALLGWSDVWSFTQGGTGYINRGTNPGVTSDKFGYRIPEAATRNPDIWVLMGSTNDLSSGASAVTAAVLADLQAIRATGSRAPIVVLGLWPLNDTAQSAGTKVAVIEAAVESAVAAFADPLAWFIPIRNDPTFPWVSGSWNYGAQTNATNAALMISGDAIHPADVGTAYLSGRIANAIREDVIPYVP